MLFTSRNLSPQSLQTPPGYPVSKLGAAEGFAPSHAARKTLKMCALECERWIDVLPHFVDHHSDLSRGWKVISPWRII